MGYQIRIDENRFSPEHREQIKWLSEHKYLTVVLEIALRNELAKSEMPLIQQAKEATK